MTIAASNLTNGSVIGTPSSAATASISPAANALVIVTVASTTSGGVSPANTPTVTGAGGTWQAISSQLDALSQRRMTMFRDLSPAPGSGALTIDYAGQAQTNIEWSVDQFTGVNTSGSHGSGAIVQVQSATTNATDTGENVTLNALASPNNAAYGSVRTNSAAAVTKGSNFTELTNLLVSGGGVNNVIETEWAINQTLVNWTWASQSVITVRMAVEISAAGNPTVTLTLNDLNGNVLANLSNLHWAWWDVSDANLIATLPVAHGTVGTTNGSGVIVLNVTGTMLTSGQFGLLALHAADWSRSGLYTVPLD